MGKGSRLRSARSHSRSAAETFLAKPENRRAMKNEINNQLSADAERFYRDEAAVILWMLHAIFGFGPERLRRFFVGYNTEWRKIITRHPTAIWHTSQSSSSSASALT